MLSPNIPSATIEGRLTTILTIKVKAQIKEISTTKFLFLKSSFVIIFVI